MRASSVVLSLVLLSGSLFAQYRGGPNVSTSLGGFGNVLYPGTGGPPPPRTGVGISPNVYFPLQLGNTVQGRPFVGAYRSPHVLDQGRNRTVVVPYAMPIIVNGAPSDAELPPPPQGYAQQPPTVIINQNFAPEMLRPSVREYPEQPPMTSAPGGGMRSYEAPMQGGRGVERADALPPRTEDLNRPTIYQIAFKSGATYSTVAYWVDGDTLNYVTPNGSVNRASLDLIDIPLSEQLNRERNVEFQLPH